MMYMSLWLEFSPYILYLNRLLGVGLYCIPIYICILYIYIYILFQCKLNVSCNVSFGNKLVYTCISVDLVLLHYYILHLGVAR